MPVGPQESASPGSVGETSKHRLRPRENAAIDFEQDDQRLEGFGRDVRDLGGDLLAGREIDQLAGAAPPAGDPATAEVALSVEYQERPRSRCHVTFLLAVSQTASSVSGLRALRLSAYAKQVRTRPHDGRLALERTRRIKKVLPQLGIMPASVEVRQDPPRPFDPVHTHVSKACRLEFKQQVIR